MSQEEFYQKGFEYLKNNSFEAAIENFKAYLKNTPEDYDVNFNLGIAYSEIGEYELAIDTFNKAIKLKPTDYSAYDSIGTVYYTKLDYNKALEYYQKSIKYAPRNTTVLYNLAYTYYILEQFDNAEQTFLKLLSINNTDADAYFNLGNIYFKKKRFKLAVINYEQTLKHSVEHEYAQSAIEEAMRCLREDVDEQTEETIPHEEIIQPEEPSSSSELVEQADIVVENESIKPQEDPVDILAKSKECIQNGDLTTAHESISKFLENNDNNLEAKEMLFKLEKLLATVRSLVDKAKASISKERIDEALELLNQAQKINPGDVNIARLIEYSLGKQKEIFEQNKRIYIGASKQLIKEGNYNAARAKLKDYLKENPHCSEGHMALGKVYMNTQEYDTAVNSFKTSLSINPEDTEVQSLLYTAVKHQNETKDEINNCMHLAKLYIQKNEHSKAIETLRKILEISTENFEIKTRVDELLNTIVMDKSSLSMDSSYALGNLVEALRENLRQVKENPDDAEAFYNLGLIYSKQNKYDLAKENLTKSLKLKPNNIKAEKLLFDVYRETNV